MPDVAETLEDLVTDSARAAVVDTAGDVSAVGPMLGSQPGPGGLITMRFACTLPGYRGWEWVADLAVMDDQVTVCEAALLPGTDALLGPAWLPWSERVQPGDLEPGMVLPFEAEDPRLMPGYLDTGDVDLDEMANFEFGLGRERVLNSDARESTAERWYRGSHGPTAASAVASVAQCSTCAFLVPLTGSMRVAFGACTNEWSASDGRVVSMDHGCGAHSQTDAERRTSEWPEAEPVVDSGALDALDLQAADPEPEVAPEAESQDTPDNAGPAQEGDEAHVQESPAAQEPAPDADDVAVADAVAAEPADDQSPPEAPQDAHEERVDEAPAE